MSGLQEFVDDAGRQWKDDVLMVAGERFDRRLGDEVGALRVDMAREFAAVRLETAKEFSSVRLEMAKEFAAVRGEMAAGFANTRADLVKWSFLFWVSQFAALSGMMMFLLRTMLPD